MGNITVSADSSPTGWRAAIQTGTPIPRNHQITFDTTGDGWAVITRYLAANDYWLVGLNTSGNPVVEQWNGSTYTQVASRPDVYAGAADVMVAFQEVRYGRSIDIWNVMSMWWNGKLVISYAERVDATITVDMFMGLAVLHSTSVTFNNLRVPDLTEIADVVTLDPGETAMSGLQRAISGKNLRNFVRYNNSLRAYRPKAQAVAYTQTQMERTHFDFNREMLATHVRQNGAYDYAEYVRTDLVSRYGHVYRVLNNPNLMSEYECAREARRAIQRMEESSIQENFSFGYLHFLETGDHLLVNGNDRTVIGMRVRQTPVKTELDLQMKGYAYG